MNVNQTAAAGSLHKNWLLLTEVGLNSVSVSPVVYSAVYDQLFGLKSEHESISPDLNIEPGKLPNCRPFVFIFSFILLLIDF